MKLRSVITSGFLFFLTVLPCVASEAEEVVKEASEAQSPLKVACLAFAAALTMAVSVIGAGSAVGRIGSAALGAAAEKPELLSKSLTFVALAEGLSVLGFAIAIMLVIKIV